MSIKKIEYQDLLNELIAIIKEKTTIDNLIERSGTISKVYAGFIRGASLYIVDSHGENLPISILNACLERRE